MPTKKLNNPPLNNQPVNHLKPRAKAKADLTQPPAPKPVAQPPAPAPKRASSLFAKIRLLAVLAVLALILRLVISAWRLSSEHDPLTELPSPAPAQAGPVAPTALPANALSAGAAMFLNSQVASLPIVSQAATSVAQNAIPLPPGGEDLRRPQRAPTPPLAPASPPPQTSASPTAPPLPPSGPTSPQTAEEQSRRSFELTRRETQLNAREQAIKELEADLNVRIAAAERSKTELKDLVTRNEAILEEQKALSIKQKNEEDALKDARLEHLVLAFKGMKPDQAGQLINSMDDMVAVSILSSMPGSNAGKILAMVQPEKAARLIKSISERRIDPKTILEENQRNQAQRAASTGGAPATPAGS
ncbi:MAG: hypothetical protein LBT86_05030 [Deltaproteobacteria bacterium]|nr:hypothetical protein [Deltaproteobacteria bacterium]